MAIPRVLIIAGSDCSGGAGIEADSRVLTTHGVYSMTATTALTVQNTLGVQDVVVTPPEIVGKMIRANLDDIGCDGIKIGMLASTETINVVASTLQEFKVKSMVLDPVMVSTSGFQLLPDDAVRNLREKLIPMCTILTPNIPEAMLLLRDASIDHKPPTNLSELKDLAKAVHQLGPGAVLLKGGHIPFTKDYQKAMADSEKSLTIDVFFDGAEFQITESPYLTSKDTHGTGCSLASAIAANLVLSSSPLAAAVTSAIRYVGRGISTSHSLGQGAGPINHFHRQMILPFTQGHFIEFLLSHPDIRPVWQQYTHHPFAKALGLNILPRATFNTYMIQDYLYLVQFARANALLGHKSTNMAAIAVSADNVSQVHTEMRLHLDYCAELGLDEEDVKNSKESLACTAYSRWMLDIGASQDWLALQMALLPCLMGYGVVADRLSEAKDSVKENNPYWKWVENYVTDGYRDAVKKGKDQIESAIPTQSPQRIEQLIQIFARATHYEIEFWNLDGGFDVV